MKVRINAVRLSIRFENRISREIKLPENADQTTALTNIFYRTTYPTRADLYAVIVEFGSIQFVRNKHHKRKHGTTVSGSSSAA